MIAYREDGKYLPIQDKTNPAEISSSSTPESLTRTFSPGPAFLTLFSSHITPNAFTLTCRLTNKWIFIPGSWSTCTVYFENEKCKRITLLGINNRLSPSQILPDSIFPITTVPMSLNLSIIGILEW